ncbi:NAD-dependent DNA ligase, partial [Morganella morganii]
MENLKVSYNYKKNRDKLFANLISIIDGILSDGVLQDDEILYLSTWLLEADAIADNDIVKLLVMRINRILEYDNNREEYRAT